MEYKLDEPINNAKDDILNRMNFVKNISKLIKGIADNKGSAVIGLQGKWGCGKTSISRLIEKEIPEDIKSIRFESWSCTEKEVLLREFFNNIINVVNSDGKIHITADEVKHYAGRCFSKLSRSISLQGGFLSNNATIDFSKIVDEVPPMSLDEEKRSINKKLNDAKIPNIVFFY